MIPRLAIGPIAFVSLLGLFAASSLVFTYTLVQFALSQRDLLPSTQQADGKSSLSQSIYPRTRDDHTYADDDFPPRLPGFDPGYVQMAVEESVRFSIWDSEASAEWSSTSPPGEGSVRLGPDDRLFYLSMFHELHCLRRFHQLLTNPRLAAHPGVLGHTQHCLNYLRQLSLCQADRTLEVGDFTDRNFTTERVGAIHTCRDWNAVYDRVTYDWSTSNWKDRAFEWAPDRF